MDMVRLAYLTAKAVQFVIYLSILVPLILFDYLDRFTWYVESSGTMDRRTEGPADQRSDENK